MKLELNHLTPYLPYKLKGVLTSNKVDDFENEDWVEDIEIFKQGAIWELSGYADGSLSIPLGEGELDGFLWSHGSTYACFRDGFKPILRPLSDLSKEIEINGERFIPIKKLNMENPEYPLLIDEGSIFLTDTCNLNMLEIHEVYEIYQKLFEWHFDVSGLIKEGLAIDINTI